MADKYPDEEPLDPKIEAIRRKMMRLLLVSGGIMLVGLMTVLIAIVYKINQSTETSAAAIVSEADITLPAGAMITDTALSDGRIMLTLKLSDGSTAIHIFKRNGEPAVRYRVK